LTLAVSDWAAIIGYLLITLFLGLYFRGRSGKSTEDYFVSGRNVSWWLAGTSMVATTFAADTPFAVGNDDGVLVRASVAALRADHRRTVR
jgi:Na+/proline symporter